MFYFCNLENHLSIMKNVFNSISIYSWKKNPPFNEYKIQMCYKKNNFFWFREKWPNETFLQKLFISNMIIDSFLVEKWKWGYVYALAFFKLLKIEGSFGKNFSSQFFAKCLNKSIKYFFKKFLKILIFYFGISLYHKV